MSVSDVLPTLLEAIGGAEAIPDGLDGASQWAALTGTGTSERPDYMIAGGDGMALYRPPWKLVVADPPLLYDVFADPLEEDDLAARHPDIVASMSETAAAWPTLDRPGQTSILGLLLDPDRFGGPEDREPWADAAKRRAEEGG